MYLHITYQDKRKMQQLRLTKDQEARIKEMSIKINKLRLNKNKSAIMDSDVAKFLLNKSIDWAQENEEELSEKLLEIGT
jgi:hypothetical protein